MNEQQREKYWQVQAGHWASIANWALVELLNYVEIGSDAHQQANDHLDELQETNLLDFDEEIV